MWHPPPMGSLKFNVDGAARTKLGLSAIGGVLCNFEVLLFLYFFLELEILMEMGFWPF